jgi:hypothetical protein
MKKTNTLGQFSLALKFTFKKKTRPVLTIHLKEPELAVLLN